MPNGVARYKVCWTHKGKRMEGQIEPNLGCARVFAHNLKQDKHVKVITILRDSGGADHPDNDGKFFLHEIVK